MTTATTKPRPKDLRPVGFRTSNRLASLRLNRRPASGFLVCGDSPCCHSQKTPLPIFSQAQRYCLRGAGWGVTGSVLSELRGGDW